MNDERVIKVVVIHGIISTGFDAYLIDEYDNIVEEHSGVVLPQFGDQDDVLELEIDNATGQIRNWKPITTFGAEDEDI